MSIAACSISQTAKECFTNVKTVYVRWGDSTAMLS